MVAYCPGGLVLDAPAKSLPVLVEWTLREAKLGAPKLSGPGKDADPLLVLTQSALKRYGLPATLTDEERHAGRLPEDHKVIKQLVRAEWKLTKRGLGPWARIYRPATGSDRQCVQLCIPSWNALDPRSWGHAGQLPPADLGYTAPIGSTDQDRIRHLTVALPPQSLEEVRFTDVEHLEFDL
ncbi:hypothetical protein ACH419_32700 [Streptomyces bobili]|uniref:hypothetical protein n=1 Tax=Streptomyces bobili TaxID=67280 RepID=UPI00378A247C